MSLYGFSYTFSSLGEFFVRFFLHFFVFCFVVVEIRLLLAKITTGKCTDLWTLNIYKNANK